jgi:hypothetical protein
MVGDNHGFGGNGTNASMDHQADDPTLGPPVRFCIVTAGRTGSTWLRLLLDSHPDITCHGEVFGENLSTLAATGSDAHHGLLAERAADPHGFLVRRVFAPSRCRAVGFKVLNRQLTQRWPSLLDALRGEPGVRIVHLVRRNLLKRFVSEYFVGTVTHRHSARSSEATADVRPIRIPVESILADLSTVRREVDAMREAFRQHPMHEIAYEDCVSDPERALGGLLGFLGAAPAPLDADIRKLLPDDLGMLVENLDELATALRGGPFEPMLGEAR